MDYEKLKEKLRWLINPFRHSGNVPQDLDQQIINLVRECEKPAEEEEAVVPEL